MTVYKWNKFNVKWAIYSLLVWFTGTFQLSVGQIINYETEISIDNDGKKTTQRTVLIQVNNKQENWLSHVELQHNPRQKLIFNYAHVLKGDGTTARKLKKKELITRNEISYQAFYQDDLITEFDLYWNQYPYRLEYSYTIIEEEYLYSAWWTPLYKGYLPTMASSLQVSVPLDYVIHISSSKDLNAEESKTRDSRKLTWRSSDTRKIPKKEIYSPPVHRLVPTVKIVPAEFEYGVVGRSESWSSFGNWLDELNKDTDQLTLQEKRNVEKLIDGINNRNEIIKQIYCYLQDHTTYINVAIDVGGLKSYPASYVCENKYGDCKALTTYMKAMLKNVGIESYYSVIKAGDTETEIDVTMPSQQFNHVVLVIPSEKDTIWLENTSSALPFGYVGTFTQNRYALVINGEDSQLIKSPKLLTNNVLREREYNFDFTRENEVNVNLNLILRGKEFEEFRYFLSENNQKLQNARILENAGLHNFTVTDWDLSNFHRDSSFIRVNVGGVGTSIVRKLGSMHVINPLRIEIPDFEKPNERQLPVKINYPINKSDKSVYDLRYFQQSEIQIPKGVSIKNKYGLYEADFFRNENELVVLERLTLFANTISTEKYDEFYQFIKSISTYKKKTALLIK